MSKFRGCCNSRYKDAHRGAQLAAVHALPDEHCCIPCFTRSSSAPQPIRSRFSGQTESESHGGNLTHFPFHRASSWTGCLCDTQWVTKRVMMNIISIMNVTLWQIHIFWVDFLWSLSPRRRFSAKFFFHLNGKMNKHLTKISSEATCQQRFGRPEYCNHVRVLILHMDLNLRGLQAKLKVLSKSVKLCHRTTQKCNNANVNL